MALGIVDFFYLFINLFDFSRKLTSQIRGCRLNGDEDLCEVSALMTTHSFFLHKK